jgi:uncharacterized protein
MMKLSDLPDTIPVFPLPGALLLPRARLPIHIFEPRYLAMFDDCFKTQTRLIGMIQPRGVPGTDEERLSAIGCAGRITGFSETDDGRYMVTLTGVSRFRIRGEVEGFTPYRRCDIDWRPFDRDLGSDESDPTFNRAALMNLLARYFQMRGLGTDWSGLKEAEDELMINSLSMLLPFTPEDKQALLEAPSLVTRRETLVTLIEFALHSNGAGEVRQ